MANNILKKFQSDALIGYMARTFRKNDGAPTPEGEELLELMSVTHLSKKKIVRFVKRNNEVYTPIIAGDKTANHEYQITFERLYKARIVPPADAPRRSSSTNAETAFVSLSDDENIPVVHFDNSQPPHSEHSRSRVVDERQRPFDRRAASTNGDRCTSAPLTDVSSHLNREKTQGTGFEMTLDLSPPDINRLLQAPLIPTPDSESEVSQEISPFEVVPADGLPAFPRSQIAVDLFESKRTMEEEEQRFDDHSPLYLSDTSRTALRDLLATTETCLLLVMQWTSASSLTPLLGRLSMASQTIDTAAVDHSVRVDDNDCAESSVSSSPAFSVDMGKDILDWLK